MKKLIYENKWKITMIIFYLLLLLILYLKGMIPTDIKVIKTQLSTVDNILFWYFMISVFRIVLFIPQSVFIIVGGLLFDPWIAFTFSLVAHALSETIIYFFTKLFFNVNKIQKFILKNKKIVYLLKKYQLKLLGLGVTCPFAPSDLLAVASAIVGIKYKHYVLTVLVASIPLTFIYSFLGVQVYEDSKFNLILIIVFIIVFVLVSYKMYKKIMKENID